MCELWKPFSSRLIFCASRSGRAVALLIFLSRTARACFVAANLRLIAHDGFDFAGFLTGSSGALVWTGESQRTTRPSSLAQRFRWLLLDHLQVEERSDRRRVDTIDHLRKHVKALFLVLNQRVLLAITNQPDALLQVIE